jgi:DNA-directed RNA polymerase II subunit RPB2
VQTQIASFDEFVQNTIQELVDESPDLTLSSNAGASGHDEDEGSENARRHEIKVGRCPSSLASAHSFE